MLYTSDQLISFFQERNMNLEFSNNSVEFFKSPRNYVSILTKDLPSNLQSLGELVDQRFAAGEAYLAAQEKAGE